MARIKISIDKLPAQKLFYLVDSCFLINKYIPPDKMNDPYEKILLEKSQEWWAIIDRQLSHGKAIVYILNVSIAEAFKSLFKQYIKKRINYATYDKARRALQIDLTLKPKDARKQKRHIKFHDIEINRDLIIGIDRFFESFLKNYPGVSTFDLLILSAARYLV